jgi:hypothetical protein
MTTNNRLQGEENLQSRLSFFCKQRKNENCYENDFEQLFAIFK